MKAWISGRRASVTIEAAIVTAVVLILIFMGIGLLLEEYTKVLRSCTELERQGQLVADSGQGEILRIIKVVADTGNRIADELFQSK